MAFKQVSVHRAQSWTEGFHHRTEIKKIFRMGAGYQMKDGKLVKNNAATEYGLAERLYSPWVVSPHNGRNEAGFIMLKVSFLKP